MNNKLAFSFKDNNKKFDFSISKNQKDKVYIRIDISTYTNDFPATYSWRSITYPYYLFVLLDEDDFHQGAKEYCLKYLKNLAFL